MRFRLLTPPTVEPVSIADLMAFARVDQDPGDGVLQRVALPARARVGRATGLALITQTWAAVLDRSPLTPHPDYSNGVPQVAPRHRTASGDGSRAGPVSRP